MRARFVLGPAGSGKTFRCLAEARAALANESEGDPLVFLAPKQATFQLERQLLAGGDIAGYTRLQILSFERLARFILENLGIAPPKLLSDEGRVMVLRALLMRHEAELKLFGRSARSPGFGQELGALLTELQQHHLTPAKLHALGEQPGLRRELRDKLDDLALISGKYADWLLEHQLQDANHLLDFATAALRQAFRTPHSALRISGLWLDGFAEMTPQELDLLAAAISCCERATLAFCLDESGAKENANSWLSIWNAVGKTYSQCRQRVENLPGCQIETELLPRGSKKNRFAQNPELDLLERFWAGPPQSHSALRTPHSALSIAACPNSEAEAVFAAREILKFVREKHRTNRFRDCAVLVRNLDIFHKPLAREFRRYEIPFFLDRRESVAHHPLAELTRGALRAVAFDWRHDDWFAALKAGFCPVAEDKIDQLENAALEFGWRGKKWRAPLPDENLERLRKILVSPFEKFSAQLADAKFTPTGAQLAETLHDLWRAFRVEETLETWSTAEAEQLPIGNRPLAIHGSVIEQMNAWLDNLALAFPREPLPLRDWLPIIEAGLAGLTVGVIPPVLDEVLIGAIDRARNPDLKFALVLGLNEGIFPTAPAPAAILTDADRDELSQTISLGPDLRERLARERYYGYIACTRASERLALTFSRFGADGKALNSSPFIAQLQGIFLALEIEEFQNEIEPAEAEHASELAPLLGAPDGWEFLLEIPALKSLADKLASLREPDEDENLSPVLAEKLFGPVLQTSVSRLEEFAQCPFRFFVHSGLRAEERKMFELDPRERGSFQHEVLKIFHEQVTAEGRRWRDLTPDEARERVGKIAAGLMEHFRAGLMRDTAQSRFEARAMAESLQDFIEVIVAWMRRQYEFDPVAAELDFGGGHAPVWELDLGGNRRLALRGRIDRIDLCRSLRTATGEAAAVVIDYKSSQNKPDALLMEHGVQLQLLAYLNVIRHWENPSIAPGVSRLVPAGVFYVNLRGQFESGATRAEALADTDAARRMAYRHAGRFDADALDKLDSKHARDQFNYRLTDAGKLYANSTEALPHGELEKLLDGVETKMREMGNTIFSGEASVNPYRKGAQTPCEFCDYRAACRIDPWTHQWRVLRAVKEIGE